LLSYCRFRLGDWDSSNVADCLRDLAGMTFRQAYLSLLLVRLHFFDSWLASSFLNDVLQQRFFQVSSAPIGKSRYPSVMWPARIFLSMVRGIERTATDWAEILTQMGFLSNSMATPQSDQQKLLQNSIRDPDARLNSGYFLLRSRKLSGRNPRNFWSQIARNKGRCKTEV
jgi:hypothetical protein